MFDQAETYKLSHTAWDTKIHNIDSFMKDTFQFYIKAQEIKEQFNEAIEMINSPFIKKDLLVKETQTFFNIENLYITQKKL